MPLKTWKVCAVCGAIIGLNALHHDVECNRTEICVPMTLHHDDLPDQHPKPTRTGPLMEVVSSSSASYTLLRSSDFTGLDWKKL